jgi:hypothetical protein
MKRMNIFVLLTALLALASLAACKGGTFNDPGHEAAGPGFTDGGSGGASAVNLPSSLAAPAMEKRLLS